MKSVFIAILFAISTLYAHATNVLITHCTTQGHYVDTIWYNTAIGMGYNAQIQPVSVLSTTAFFSTTDVLIISSPFDADAPNTAQLNNVLAFIKKGGQVYVQSEYDSSFLMNKAFTWLVNKVGGTFQWNGTTSSNIQPAYFFGSFATTPNILDTVPFLIWGCRGTGACPNVTTFCGKNGFSYGFECCPDSAGFGHIATISDDGWILLNESPNLRKNILYHLVANLSCNSFIVNLGANQTACASAPVILNAGNRGATFLWSTGDTTQKITAQKTGSYWVHVNIGGCIAADTVQITVYPAPTKPLGKDTILCDTKNYTLNAANPGCTYLWSTGATTQTITVNTTGLYWVKITLAQCVLSDSIKLQFNTTPKTSLGPDTSLCFGTLYTLNPGTGLTTFNWSTGATTPTINVNTSGTYSVTTSNGNGCPAKDTVKIVVYPAVLDKLGHDTTLCVSSYVLNAGNPGDTYLWNTGAASQTITAINSGLYWVKIMYAQCSVNDSIKLQFNTPPKISLGPDTSLCFGTVYTLNPGSGLSTFKWSTGATTPTIKVNSSGTYSVTAGNGNGCPVSDTVKITVRPAISINLGNDTTLCAPSYVLNSGNPGIPHLWSNGDTTQQITVITTGTYKVIVGKHGCEDSAQLTVTLLTVAKVSLGNDTTLCNGRTITLNAGAGYTSYLWQNGSTLPTFFVDSTGTYYVHVSTANGCKAADTIAITIEKPIVINLGNDTTICNGTSIILNAGKGFSIYTWNTGATTPTITVNSVGAYVVYVTDKAGCTGSDTILVYTIAPAYFSIGHDTATCIGTPVTITATAGMSSYQWNTGSTGQTTTVLPPDTIEIIAKDKNKCFEYDTLYVGAYQPTHFSLGADQLLCHFSLDTLAPDSTLSEYLWNDGSTAHSITIVQYGSYWLRGINAHACISYDTVNIINNCPPKVYVPTAFSPNGDGINDVLLIRADNISQFAMQIYNRWGQVVFETNSINTYWDGKYNGQPAPMGAYLWHIHYIGGNLDSNISNDQVGSTIILR